jgi:hypothetical protein
MKHQEKKRRLVYLRQMTEITESSDAAKRFLDAYKKSNDKFDFDCAVLQLRKALEATAYASIAPNKTPYEAFRARAEKSTDYTKDFNATKIFQYLSRFNESFYPLALLPAQRLANRNWHFERKESGCLTQKRFTKIYDRMGKYLHADNPWGIGKHRQNMTGDSDCAILKLRELVELHVAFIKTRNYKGAWVVQVPKDGSPPSILPAVASGDFRVAGS